MVSCFPSLVESRAMGLSSFGKWTNIPRRRHGIFLVGKYMGSNPKSGSKSTIQRSTTPHYESTTHTSKPGNVDRWTRWRTTHPIRLNITGATCTSMGTVGGRARVGRRSSIGRWSTGIEGTERYVQCKEGSGGCGQEVSSGFGSRADTTAGRECCLVEL